MNKKRICVLLLLILLAAFTGVVFGFSHEQSWEDASQYSAYAKNMVLGNGYSSDGIHFDSFREPGYSFFLAIIYRIFGIENFNAVKIAQIFLLALSGYFTYLVFELYSKRLEGIVAAAVIALIPNYGFYVGELLSETLFTFFLAVSFYLIVRIWKNRQSGFEIFSLAGLILGYTVLIRTHMLFFGPLILILALIFSQRFKITKLKLAVASLAFLAVIMGWMSYVYSQSGHFVITQNNRIDLSIYVRSERTKLAYSGQAKYLYDWLKRSVVGGGGTQFLIDHEFHFYYKILARDAVAPEQKQVIRQQGINYILTHLGSFLFGDIVEAIKTASVEHTYGADINRYLRAGTYGLLYFGFIYGCWMLFRRRLGELQIIVSLSVVFVLYNYMVISSFDSIPRYNTPYLFFYAIVAIAGIWTIPVVKKYTDRASILPGKND